MIEPASVPKRFQITVVTMHRKTVSYSICTWLDERKAIALAAQVHLQRSPDDQLYDVVSVLRISGNEPEESDIIDRIEW